MGNYLSHLITHITIHQLVSFIREVGDEVVPQKVETTLLKLLAFINREPSSWTNINLVKNRKVYKEMC